MLNLSGIRLATTACPASGDSVTLSDSYLGHVTILPVMPAWVPSPVKTFAVTCAATGQASRPVEGSMVPAREFDRGWLNMSWVSWPVKSPRPPKVSHRMISKPPRPGSMGATVPFPPPPSCSPLSGKSSSNTMTESFAVGSGVGATFSMPGAKAAVLVVQALGPPKRLQAGAIGAPLMVWPQAVFRPPLELNGVGRQLGALV